MAEACPEAAVPPELEALVHRLLAKEPAMRPKSAEALAVELNHLVETGVASTSGVRFSMARSMPPPNMVEVPPPPSSSIKTLAESTFLPGRSVKLGVAAAVALALVVAMAATFGSSGSGPRASSLGATAAGAPSAVTAVPSPAIAATSAQARAPEDIPPPEATAALPTVSVDDLPRVQPASAPEPPRPAPRRPRPGAKPANAATGTGPPAGPVTPPPAPSTGYGLLE